MVGGERHEEPAESEKKKEDRREIEKKIMEEGDDRKDVEQRGPKERSKEDRVGEFGFLCSVVAWVFQYLKGEKLGVFS